MMKTTFLLIALSFISILPQSDSLKFLHRPSFVSSVAFEGNYVWAASHVGLMRYDKLTGEKFFFNSTNSFLPISQINAIEIDKKGNRWVFTNGGLVKFGPDRIDLSHGEIFDLKGFRYWSLSATGLDNYDNVLMTSFESWLTGDFELTLGIFNAGEYRTITDQNLPTARIDRIVVDNNNNLWLKSRTKLYVRNKSGIKSITEKDNSAFLSEILDLTVDTEGMVWALVKGHILHFDGNTWKSYDYPVTDEVIWSGRSYLRVRENTIYCFLDNSLYRLDKQCRLLSKSKLPEDDIVFIADFEYRLRTRAFEIDEAGTAWFGGRMGLVSYDGKTWKIHHNSNFMDTESEITALATDTTGNLWLGLYNPKNDRASVFTFDGITGKKQSVTLPQYHRIVNLYFDINNQMLIHAGLFSDNIMYNYNGKILNKIKFPKGISIENMNFRSSSDPKRNIYLLTTEQLVKFDGKKWKLQKLDNKNAFSKHGIVATFTFNSYGRMWFQRIDENIQTYDGKTQTDMGKKHGTESFFKVDNKNVLWTAATDYLDNEYHGLGVRKYEVIDHTRISTSRLQFPSSRAVAIEVDKYGNKWILTRDGIVIYNEEGILGHVINGIIKMNHSFLLPLQD